MFTSHLCLISLLLPSAEQQTPREYVIREVMPPILRDARLKFDWQATWFSGDSDLNGEADFMFQGRWSPKLGSPLTAENYLQFRPGHHEESFVEFFDRQGIYDLSLNRWALLKTPAGFQALIHESKLGPGAGVHAFDWDTGVDLGLVPPATGFPFPIPDAGKFEALFPAGDQNGDGYEDFFWTNRLSVGSGYSYCGLYDGATKQSIWQWAKGNTGVPVHPYSVNPQLVPDLNGDGLSDLLLGFPHIDQVTGVRSHTYIAFSGPDGSVIWWENDLGWVATNYGFGPDLSGDGIPDPVFLETEPLQFRALDATNGAELWVTTTASLEAQYPGSQVEGYTTWRGFMANLDQPDSFEYVNYHRVFLWPSSTIAFAHYDALDGTFLGSYPIPTTLEPWSVDSSTASDTSGPMRLGDIDRDGLEEIGIPFADWQRSPAWSTGGSNPKPGTQLAVIGLRTLFVAESFQLGTGNLDFKIAIPAGVNKDFAIIISTEFDPYGGLTLGPWKTFLGPSPALDYTLVNRNIAGTLDANGKASIGVAIPPHPALLGETLYSKTLVFNPPGSSEMILTMSSMGITELL